MSEQQDQSAAFFAALKLIPSDPLDREIDGWTLRDLMVAYQNHCQDADGPVMMGGWNAATPAQKAAVSERLSVQLRAKISGDPIPEFDLSVAWDAVLKLQHLAAAAILSRGRDTDGSASAARIFDLAWDEIDKLEFKVRSARPKDAAWVLRDIRAVSHDALLLYEHRRMVEQVVDCIPKMQAVVGDLSTLHKFGVDPSSAFTSSDLSKILNAWHDLRNLDWSRVVVPKS